jgi:competence protein ComEA
MSDDDYGDLLRPSAPRTWRERLAEWAEALDMSPTRLLVGGAVLVVVGLAGWRLLAPPPPPPEMRIPFTSTSAPGSGPSSSSAVPVQVVVHVAGAVNAPGVQRLASGARVVDAVEAAGGARVDADVGRINLAAVLEDGQQVYVPAVGEEVAPRRAVDPGTSDEPIDLNDADADELDALPGIGPALAQAIVAHREQHGPFASIDELLDVRGIGEAKLDQLRPLVTV